MLLPFENIRLFRLLTIKTKNPKTAVFGIISIPFFMSDIACDIRAMPLSALPFSLNAVPAQESHLRVAVLVSSHGHIPFGRSFSCNPGKRKSRNIQYLRGRV